MSISEYVKQRALGFEPKPVLPDVFFHFCEKIDMLVNDRFTDDTEAKTLRLVEEISDTFIKPRKEDKKEWQPQDSGQ